MKRARDAELDEGLVDDVIGDHAAVAPLVCRDVRDQHAVAAGRDESRAVALPGPALRIRNGEPRVVEPGQPQDLGCRIDRRATARPRQDCDSAVACWSGRAGAQRVGEQRLPAIGGEACSSARAADRAAWSRIGWGVADLAAACTTGCTRTVRAALAG